MPRWRLRQYGFLKLPSPGGDQDCFEDEPWGTKPLTLEADSSHLCKLLQEAKSGEKKDSGTPQLASEVTSVKD